VQQSVSYLFDQSHIEVRLLQQSQILSPVVWVHQNGGRHAAFNQVLIAHDRVACARHEVTLLRRIQVNDVVDPASPRIYHICKRDAFRARPAERHLLLSRERLNLLFPVESSRLFFKIGILAISRDDDTRLGLRPRYVEGWVIPADTPLTRLLVIRRRVI
jgi:hypothetical protein